eukprot:6802404-Ditylum_brightwellii.AAC.1
MALPSPAALSTNLDNNDPVILMAELGNCFQAAQQDTPLAITLNIAGIQNSSQTALSRVKRAKYLIKIAKLLNQGKHEMLAGILSGIANAL